MAEIRTELRTEGIRTQEDAAPIHGREVRFAGPAGVLGGSLQLPPPGVDPLAVVVCLHGSGPQDRDENSPGAPLQIFNAFAADCAAAGLASLRYDKRGVGESGGDLLAADVHDLAADGLAAVRFARRLHETHGLPVFLLGHSEGATLAMLVAAMDPTLAGLVLLAPSLSPMETLLRQQAAAVQQAIAALPASQREEFGIPPGFDQRAATEELIAAVRAAPPEHPVIEFMGQPVPARWFQSHFALDLGALAGQVRCPVLVVGGSKDAQVPPRDAQALAARVRQAAEARGETPDVTAAFVPDLTHILRRTDGPGDPSGYAALAERPVDPDLRRLVQQWLAEHLPRPAAEPQ